MAALAHMASRAPIALALTITGALLAASTVAVVRMDHEQLATWAERGHRLPSLVLAPPDRTPLQRSGEPIGRLDAKATILGTRELPTRSPIIAIVPMGRQLAVASFDDGAWLLDDAQRTPLELGNAVNDLATDGATLFAATNDGAFEVSADRSTRLLSKGVFTAVTVWRGQPWFASPRGVSTLDAQGFVTFGAEHGLTPTRPSAISCCGDALCVGAEDGLWRFDGANVERFVSGRGQLPSDEVTAVAFDGSRIWAGTFDAGFARIEEGRARLYSTRDGLRDGRVWPRAMAAGHRVVVAGTPSGLSVLRGERAAQLVGLVPDEVTAVAADKSGFWLGHRGAITHVEVSVR